MASRLLSLGNARMLTSGMAEQPQHSMALHA